MRKRLCFLFFLFTVAVCSAQQGADASFSSSTDFRTVNDGFVRIAFTLAADPSPAMVDNATAWASANQGKMELSFQGKEVKAAMSADVNSEAAWRKLFHVLGVVTFEVSDVEETQTHPIELFFQHFEI